MIIIGSSGSGKINSPLLHQSSRDPTAERFSIVQNVLDPEYDLTTTSEKLGMVFQSLHFFENLNVLEIRSLHKQPSSSGDRECRKLLKKTLKSSKMGSQYWAARPKQLSKANGSPSSGPLTDPDAILR